MAATPPDRPLSPAQGRALAVLAGLGACYLVGVVAQVLRLPSPFPLGDFFALWSSARVLATEPPGTVYDTAALHALQLAMGQDTPDLNPYPYPPQAALIFLPMAGLGYGAAAALFLGGGLLAYLAALGAGTRNARPLLLAAVLAPSTAASLCFGQAGLLVAALLIGGLRLAGTRPVAAGLLFALLTFKPQFGLMVPVALLAAGHRRCIAATALATLVLAAAATLWQGPGIWSAWLAALPGYQAWFATRAMGIMPTVEASLHLVGAPAAVTQGAQAAAALLAAACTWQAWRTANPLCIPITLAATALATPHGFVYDLPLLSGGIILFAAARGPARLGWPEAAGLAAALALPALLNLPGRDLPIAAPVLLLALGLMHRPPAAAPRAALHPRAQPA